MTRDVAGIIQAAELELGDLLAQHEAIGATALAELHAYRDDPHAFLRDAWPDFTLTPAQREAVDLLKTSNRLCLYGANGTGKDAVMGRLILWFIFARDGFVVITTPTQRQSQQTIINREIRPAFESSRLPLPGTLFSTAVKREDNPQSGLVSFAGGSLSAMSGYHYKDFMFLLCEAQGVPDHAWEAATACCTDEANVIVAVGNPIHRDGKFEAASVRWPSVRFSALDVVGLNLPGAASRAWVDEVRDEWGEDSDWFRVHVIGLFPVNDSDTALVTREMLARAVALHRGEDVVPPGRWTFSLDPSEGKYDASVLAAQKDGYLVKLHTWHRANATATRDKVIEILSTYQCVPPADLFKFVPGDVRGPHAFDLIVDSVAFGSGVSDILEEAGFIVTRFKSSHKPSDAWDGDSQFYDKRAECYWQVRLKLQAGTLALPDHPALFEELLNTRWGLTSTEKIKIEVKKLIKARIGHSPDHADALMQTMAPANQCTGLASMVDL